MRIAQRFNAGSRASEGKVPKGRLRSGRVQPSLRDSSSVRPSPSVETLGYSRLSLRDGTQNISAHQRSYDQQLA